jgi:hypothetical protein
LLWFVLLMTAILPRLRWKLNVVWFAFPLWPRMVSISSCIYWPFILSRKLFGRLSYTWQYSKIIKMT